MIYEILGSGGKEFYVNLKLVKSVSIDSNSVTIDGTSLLKNTYTIDVQDLVANWVNAISEPIENAINSWPLEKLEVNPTNDVTAKEVETLVNASSSILNSFEESQKSNTSYAVFLADDIIKKSKAKKGVL